MNEHPWHSLDAPTSTGTINARRVDAQFPWDFFWAVDSDRRSLLVLRYSAGFPGKLPKLKGVEVLNSRASEHAVLVFRLLDAAHRDLFYRLCKDIVRATSAASSEIEAVRLALARTWRWHHLLGRGSDGRLTEEEQKGLIGELSVLDRLLLDQLTAIDAVMAWRGPLGAPKDFEIGRVCIEAKARRGGGTPNVTINSEHQLDDSGIDALFLYVTEVVRAPSSVESGMSITEFAARVRQRIEAKDPGALEPYLSMLEAAGLRSDDDYSDILWVEGSSRLYHVDQKFPRITASQVPGGISQVRYSLSLVECEPFLVAESDFSVALKGETSVD